jgi:hypothetical protein
LKICWDNLEGLHLTRNGNFSKKINGITRIFIYRESCRYCQQPFLANSASKKKEFCDTSCANSGQFSPSYGGLSNEHKKKIGRSNSGTNHPLFGKGHSKETKIKMSLAASKRVGNKNSFFGRTHTKETKRKISRKNKGENYGQCGPTHSQWRGGISYEPYCVIWTDEDFKESIKERDNYNCQNPLCEKGKPLRVHHINYIKKDCRPANLITLCASCNSKANKDREWHMAFYKEILRRKNII